MPPGSCRRGPALPHGNFDRVKPRRNFTEDGAGAFELALRYDRLDLSGTPVLARAGNRAESLTFGLSRYLNPFAKPLFNWVHFNGTHTPLDPIGTRTAGDAFGTRLHVDFATKGAAPGRTRFPYGRAPCTAQPWPPTSRLS